TTPVTIEPLVEELARFERHAIRRHVRTVAGEGIAGRHGRRVGCAVASRKSGGAQNCACRIPRPPAVLTAATLSGPVKSGPIGAATMVYSIPSMWQSAVFIVVSAEFVVMRSTRTEVVLIASNRVNYAAGQGSSCRTSC